MVIMGVDTSTKTGIVIREYDEDSATINTLHKEKIHFKTKKGIDRAELIGLTVADRAKKYNVDLAYIEGYGFSFKGSGIILIEIGTMVRYFLHKEGVNYSIVPPTSLKKFATGSGNASKDTIIKEVYKRWGFDTDDNDIADAFGLCMFGMAHKGAYLMPKKNMEAVLKWVKDMK